ncbi:MAG TPA: cell division topological specificity factor MinE [Candidatus Avidehalobacter gallistercoris]|uniref:Cell division topological specificity factor n=1 Tax=Candidatus Avidehalobacter gallistercoris TaxID=2840694 RepID=A0A9D1HKF0_9FIRM|nr:cell division topological specificity factor MinE [Candidatus Avidehalobacter gallistercoris]
MSFSELLTKFFPKEEARIKPHSSKEIAKERLRLVLVQDRGNSIPDDTLIRLRSELIDVISRYMVIDETQLDMGFNKSEGEIALVASIPVVRIKQ